MIKTVRIKILKMFNQSKNHDLFRFNYIIFSQFIAPSTS